MTDTRAEAAYLRSLAAFRTPTLDLLHGRYAPFVVAALSLVFTVDRPAVAVADAHAEVGEILDELRASGYDDGERPLPTMTARELCRYWVRVGWLVPQIDDEGEVYRLTAHAVGALEITGRTGGGRTRVSTSRVRTLLEAVDRLPADAESDPERRLERLRAERDALDAEIAKLSAAGASEPVDDEQLLEEAENVLHLARELPADFSRVAESIKAMQRDVVADLRRDVRPTGEVLREYLQRGQHVMHSTPEGRAFAGALRLIGDPERIDDLTDQLHTLLAQPFTRLMDSAQREELDAIGRRVELGVQEVLTAQRRASHVITGQVRTHDPVRDRQVDDLLRDVMSGLQEWTASGSPDAPVEPVRSLPTADLGHLRQTIGDIRPPGSPAPLVEASDVEFLDADTRAWGGPHYAELEAYVTGLGSEFDLGDAFRDAADATRRPVDLLGLLEIAHRNGMSEGESISIVEALRPDGTTRRFAFGSVTARTAKESDDE
jgi:DNA-binding transcriptional MerR regulator